MELYISRGGQQYGPYTPAVVKDWYATGRLEPHDLAWYKDAPGWMSLSAALEAVEAAKAEVLNDGSLFKMYDVKFSKMPLLPGQFNLKGSGRLFINNKEGVVEMSDDESRSTFETIPGKIASKLPLFGWVFKLMLDLEFAGVSTVKFLKSEIEGLRREGSVIMFSAPAKVGGKWRKTVRLSVLSEQEAWMIQVYLGG